MGSSSIFLVWDIGKDVDNTRYWVEIIGQNDASKTEDVKETDINTYTFVSCYVDL